VIRVSDERSCFPSSAATPCQIVGTPAAIVTRSEAISAASDGALRSGPGMTKFAPAITVECARPHALAWNIGTIGRIVSRSLTASVSASMHAMPCRICERWL